jgi:hypothetical protein
VLLEHKNAETEESWVVLLPPPAKGPRSSSPVEHWRVSRSWPRRSGRRTSQVGRDNDRRTYELEARIQRPLHRRHTDGKRVLRWGS